MASLVNSIVIPMIANRFIKVNIYQKNGLADDIFMLGLTNALVPPVLKIIDGGYYYTKLMQWIKRGASNFLLIQSPNFTPTKSSTTLTKPKWSSKSAMNTFM
jgi:hypothetical protein